MKLLDFFENASIGIPLSTPEVQVSEEEVHDRKYYPGSTSSGRLKRKVRKIVGGGKMSCRKASTLKNHPSATPKDKLRATWYQNLHCKASKQIRESETPAPILEKYTSTHHGAMSLVLHELTQMPLYGLYDSDGNMTHSFVMDPYSKTALDIRGALPLNSINKTHGISGNKVRATDKSALFESMHCPNKQDIAEAGQVAKQYLWHHISNKD